MSNMKTWTYYTRMRPPGPGCQPLNGLYDVVFYDTKKRVVDGIEAWGEVTYNRPLTNLEVENYELYFKEIKK